MPIYLYIDILVILFPFLLSFDKKVAYYKKWKYLFPAILLSGAFFVAWDMLFTHLQVWSFNPAFLLGIKLGNLPLEEVLFFFGSSFQLCFCVRSTDCLYTKGFSITLFLKNQSAIFSYFYCIWIDFFFKNIYSFSVFTIGTNFNLSHSFYQSFLFRKVLCSLCDLFDSLFNNEWISYQSSYSYI